MSKLKGLIGHIWRPAILSGAGMIALAALVFVGLVDVAEPLTAQAIPAFQPAEGDRLAFDVASVKASPPDAPQESNFPLNAGAMYTPNGGRLYGINFPLITYIVFAYNLLGNQIQALVPQIPRWATTDGFDIEARVAGNPTKDQMRVMMRSLLADRFKFAIHTEAREVPVLAFTLAKPGKLGPQLRPHPAGAPSQDAPCQTDPSAANPVPDGFFEKVPGGFPAICNGILGVPPSAPGRSRLGGRNVTIAFMAGMFSQRVNAGRPMIDATGLTGTFDFLIEFVLDSQTSAVPPDANSPQPADGPSFGEALQDQLGLKIQSRKSEMQMIVVDHVERPSAN
ncbi:MAG TPA: TIGR03435 family protein [Bryobacteraceae bacterium]